MQVARYRIEQQRDNGEWWTVGTDRFPSEAEAKTAITERRAYLQRLGKRADWPMRIVPEESGPTIGERWLKIPPR
jgi:hypothetical protein